MTLSQLINELIRYGIDKKLLSKLDYDYVANRLIAIYNEKVFEKLDVKPRDIHSILADLAKFAYDKGIIESNDVVTFDNFKAKLMDELLPKPSEVIRVFKDYYNISPKHATNYLYDLAINSNYIQAKRNSQNESWSGLTKYGLLELTINLAKPEKDPKLIALQKSISYGYPKCHLCVENEGYTGHIGYDSKANMRIIPITLNGENWRFQYSPYAYYPEHSIVLNEEHVPMVIDDNTFIKLIDFLDLFPHYFVGSNSGLTIVGGSILSHEHFQAGNYKFPIESAKEVFIGKYISVSISRLIWPMSTIRISSDNKLELIDYASRVLNQWREYQNKDLLIINSNDEIHNTITPIARKNDNIYTLDLVLRNNYTNDEYPDGVFHVHPKYYNLKKENLGLIEAMGLGVLPPRLKQEFKLLEEILKGNHSLMNNPAIQVHKEWLETLHADYNHNYEVTKFIREEAVKVFEKILECAGVFKQDLTGIKHFEEFIKNTINMK